MERQRIGEHNVTTVTKDSNELYTRDGKVGRVRERNESSFYIPESHGH